MNKIFIIRTIEEWELVLKYIGDRINLCNVEGVDLTQISSCFGSPVTWISDDLQYAITNSDVFVEVNTDVGRKVIKDIQQFEKLQSI